MMEEGEENGTEFLMEVVVRDAAEITFSVIVDVQWWFQMERREKQVQGC